MRWWDQDDISFPFKNFLPTCTQDPLFQCLFLPKVLEYVASFLEDLLFCSLQAHESNCQLIETSLKPRWGASHDNMRCSNMSKPGWVPHMTQCTRSAGSASFPEAAWARSVIPWHHQSGNVEVLTSGAVTTGMLTSGQKEGKYIKDCWWAHVKHFGYIQMYLGEKFQEMSLCCTIYELRSGQFILLVI